MSIICQTNLIALYAKTVRPRRPHDTQIPITPCHYSSVLSIFPNRAPNRKHSPAKTTFGTLNFGTLELPTHPYLTRPWRTWRT